MNNLFSELTYKHIESASLKEAVRELSKNELIVAYLYIDFPHESTFRRKEYYNVTKVQLPSKLDDWIYKNMVKDDEYRKYLDAYLPLKEKLGYSDVDGYVLKKHYYRKAITLLRKRYKKFNLKSWMKPRNELQYERRKEIRTADGMHLPFDFRNSVESYFIYVKNDNKFLNSIGGSGSSSQRYNYSFFTTACYFLRKKKIQYYLFRYNGKNELAFLKELKRPIITADLGANYHLERPLYNKIWRFGIDYENIKRKYFERG